MKLNDVHRLNFTKLLSKIKINSRESKENFATKLLLKRALKSTDGHTTEYSINNKFLFFFIL